MNKNLDVVITGWKEGKGKLKGMVGSIMYSQIDPITNELKQLGSVAHMPDSVRLHIANDFISFYMTVMEIRKTNKAPVFVKFKPDKKWYECVMEV